MGEAGGAEETCRVSVGAGPPAVRGPGLWRPLLPHAEPHREVPGRALGVVCGQSGLGRGWGGDRIPGNRACGSGRLSGGRWACSCASCVPAREALSPVAGWGLFGLTVARLSQPPHVVVPERGGVGGMDFGAASGFRSCWRPLVLGFLRVT